MIYLFSGENTFEVDQQAQALIDGFDGEVEKIDGSELAVEQLPDLLAGATLFSSKRLIVIKNASSNRPIWAALGEWFEKGAENDVVLIEINLDKRTKTYKWLSKHAKSYVAKYLQQHEAVGWVVEQAKQRGFDMSRSVAQFFVDYVGTDQWRLLTELKKIELSGLAPTVELIRQITEPTPQATSFELLDAAFRGQHESLRRIFADVSKGEDPYMFFGLLAGQCYAIALMQTAEGKHPEEIAKTTGVHPFVLKKCSVLASDMTKSRLKLLTERLAELDSNMKSRPVEPWTQIYSFLKSLKT